MELIDFACTFSFLKLYSGCFSLKGIQASSTALTPLRLKKLLSDRQTISLRPGNMRIASSSRIVKSVFEVKPETFGIFSNTFSSGYLMPETTTGNRYGKESPQWVKVKKASSPEVTIRSVLRNLARSHIRRIMTHSEAKAQKSAFKYSVTISAFTPSCFKPSCKPAISSLCQGVLLVYD